MLFSCGAALPPRLHCSRAPPFLIDHVLCLGLTLGYPSWGVGASVPNNVEPYLVEVRIGYIRIHVHCSGLLSLADKQGYISTYFDSPGSKGGGGGGGCRISTDIISLTELRSDPYLDKHMEHSTARSRRVLVINTNLEYQMSTLNRCKRASDILIFFTYVNG